MTRADATMTAAIDAVREGHVLHVRAARVAASRRRGQDALVAVDLTVGPDGRGAFLVVDYVARANGREEPFATAEEALHVVRRALRWERFVAAIAPTLAAIYGTPERPSLTNMERDAQALREGTRMRMLAESRPVLRGPLFY